MKRVLSIGLILIFVLTSCTPQQKTATSVSTTTDATTQAPSETNAFSWRQSEGAHLKVLLNTHQYAEAIIEKLPEFEALTGISVDYTLTLEESYFDKLSASLSSHNKTPDVFMTGAYEIWKYASKGYLEPLDSYLDQEVYTSSDYQVEDFYPKVIDGLRYSKEAKPQQLYALPIGFEFFALAYNKRIFAEKGLTPPTPLMN